MKTFGRYQLLRRLAAGGMAEVFLATGPNPVGAELIAVKLIHAHIAEDPGFMAMFLDEARVTAPLSHPNLVQIFDLGQAEGRLYLAMELIRGFPLQVIRQAAEQRGQGLGAARSAAIVQQAALGLHCAHEARGPRGELLGLVHRDVSPQNLMLDQDGVVKVVDFGVAKAQGQLATSQKGGLKGKAGYSAPEQLRHKPIDRRADVYALGSVLFELATGEPLFPGKSEAEILQRMLFEPMRDLRKVRDLPAGLAEIIGRAVAADPSDRYPTAQALAEALSGFTRTGRAELAQLMAQLFPPFPRTVQEARDERQSSGPKRTTSQPAITRPQTGPLAPPDQTAVTHSGGAALPGPGGRPAGKEVTRPSKAPDPEAGTVSANLPDFDPDDDEGTLVGGPMPVPLGVLPTEVTARQRALSKPGRTRTGERRTDPSGPHKRSRPSEPSEETTTTHGTSTNTDTKPAPPPRRPQRLPAWAWLALGAGLGLAGVGVVIGLHAPQEPHAKLDQAQAQPAAAARSEHSTDPTPAPVSDPPKPRLAEAQEVPHPAEVAVEPPREHESAARHAPGLLTVLAAPWANVRLDGRALGATPLYKQVVAAGRHRLELTNPDEKLKKVLTVVIAPHKETIEKVVLEPQK